MSTVTAHGANSSNTSSFLTALVVNGALLGVEVCAFLVMKQHLARIFGARTYLPPPAKRSKPLPKGLWRWLPSVISSPSEDIIHKNGLDAYMFLRFVRMLIRIFLVFTVMTFAVVVPVNFVGRDSAESHFEKITWTNLTDPKDQPRFAAHVAVVYVLTFVVIYFIRSEMSHFVHMRHQFLLSPSHSAHAQARTVLLTSVPDDIANEHDMRQFASFVPGGVDKVWIYRDTKELNHWFEERQHACGKLEGAISSLLKDATQVWRKKEKMWKKQHKNTKKAQKKAKEHVLEEGAEKHPSANIDIENQQDEDEMVIPPPSREFLEELVPSNKRPKHRVGLLGMFGRKVDTIDWYKQEISVLNIKIRQARAKLVEGRPLGSVFILCNLQMGAHILAQCVSYHEPLRMIDKWIETHPKDIVWRNLDDSALEMRWRSFISWLALAGLIFAWSFPAAFIGTLSNVDSLCSEVHWLSWICRDLPRTVQNIMQGFLPPVLLAALFALLPLILRALAWYGNIPRHSLISINVYRRFFIFLLIHGFLIVTVTSGITQAIEEIISTPTSTLQKLANQLPAASVFFLSYMVTQGMSGAGMALIQLFPLIIHYFRKLFLGRTPRQAFAVTFRMPSIDFGETLPRLSLLATITFAYSVLNPLINFLACVSYIMMYIAYKFLFLQVLDQPDQFETGGLYFPMAISNLFVGLYVEQISLACLFFLKSANSISRPAALAEGVMMLILVGITAFTQATIRRSYRPITEFLPMSLATKQMAERYASKKHDGHGENDNGDMDLFSRHHITSVRRRITKIPKAIPKTIGGTLGTIGTITAKAGAKVGVAVGLSSGFSDHGHGHEQHELQPRGSSSPSALSPITVAAAEPSGIRDSSELNHGDDHGDDHPHEEHHELMNDTPVLTTRTPDRTSASTPTISNPLPSIRPSVIARKLSRQPSSIHDTRDHPYEELVSPEKTSPRPFLNRAGTSSSSQKRREKGESVVTVPPPPREEDEEDLDDHAFDHPSTYVEQQWIWVPKDRLGLSKVIIQELKDAGVEASDDGATMDKKGVVEVTRNPPDEVWDDGHEDIQALRE